MGTRHDIIAQEVGGETIVYQVAREEYHLLNPLAAFVFRHADAETSVADLTARAREALGDGVEPEQVELALEELGRTQLLESHAGESAATRSLTMSRRAMAKRLTALAFSAPLITSLVAPSPAMAASGHFKLKGNNGVGNGVDPAPPGIGNQGNDAYGQTPGNPGGNNTAPGQTGGNPTGNGNPGGGNGNNGNAYGNHITVPGGTVNGHGKGKNGG